MTDYPALAQLIVDCEKRDRHLTSWEVDFLTDMGFRVSAKAYLSDKQIAKLEAIHERVTDLQPRTGA